MRHTAGRWALRLAALALLGLLQVAWQLSAAPVVLKVGVAGLLALALVRPAWALLVWAGLAPLSTSLAGLAGSPLPGAQLLEAMTCAVLVGAVARGTSESPSRLALPALWMGAVALASGLSEIPSRLISITQEHVGYGTIAVMLVRHAVDRLSALDPWYFALMVTEGVALAWAAETLARREPDVPARVVWCALLGHAGVAVLNIARVVGASLRGGEFPASLPGMFLRIREHTQYDVNAAASIFVIVILAAIGLASRRARGPVFLAIGAVTAALWVAGSRMAMAALLVTATAVIALRARRSAKAVWGAGAAVLIAGTVVAWLASGYPAGRNLSVPKTIASRLVLFKAALGMAADAPMLGVGAGTFLEESPNYGATALAPLVYDGRTRDNAHNYFLQTMAEQGVVGLVALLAMLAAALWPAVRPAPRRDTLTPWLTAGIVASLLTWLTGHPLLVTEAALVFWLFVGTLAGTVDSPAPSPALRRVVIAAVIAIAVSIPFRAAREERAASLEHLATGLSLWQPAVDGERYRVAGTAFSLFLPSGTMMVLPIRSAIDSDVTVELRLDSRIIDAVVAEAGAWRRFHVRVPESPSRYVRIEFRVTAPADGCQSCVWVGKAIPVTPR